MAAKFTASIFTWFRKLFPGSAGGKTIVVAYKSYGTADHIYLRGRVLEDNTIKHKDARGPFRMIAHTIQRFNTFEKPFETVVAKISNHEFTETTNLEGFFRLQGTIKPLAIDQDQINWVPIECHLKEDPSICAQTQMMIPSVDQDFGIISDIDDTIMHTGVASFLKWRLFYNSALKHVQKRKPLIGVSPFYKALSITKRGEKNNPFFYISNSPWNLYNYLNQFLQKYDFPEGPILLRDFAWPGTKGYRNEKNHKQREIINIFNTYPKMKFVMIGDSAEHDASIYSEVARQFPERVICIYLHTVKKRKRMEYVQGIVDTSKHVEMLLVNTTKDAAIHAKERGLITENQYESLIQKMD